MEKYDAKLQPDSLQAQLVAAKGQMIAAYQADAEAQYLVEGAIQTAMSTTGTLTSSLLTSAYMAFGKSILRLCRRYATNGTVRDAQCTIAAAKAVARGLNNNVCGAIVIAIADISA